MDPSMLDAAGQALVTIMDPYRLMLLGAGVVMGLVLGILPGIGGLAGTALLLPFTFNMDPYAAFALLLGLGATTATGDPIPAIMFGVPGGAGSAATVLDGLPMAKRGEAGRALSAAYMSSMPRSRTNRRSWKKSSSSCRASSREGADSTRSSSSPLISDPRAALSTSASARTSFGRSSASCSAVAPPREWPIRTAGEQSNFSRSSPILAAKPGTV